MKQITAKPRDGLCLVLGVLGSVGPVGGSLLEGLLVAERGVGALQALDLLLHEGVVANMGDGK